MAVVYRGITAPKEYTPTEVTPELMDEMVIRVEERIAFKHRFGSYISRLSLAAQHFDEAAMTDLDDDVEHEAACTLHEVVEDLLAEWRTL